MQRLLDAGAIIRTERGDSRTNVCNVFVRYRRLGKITKISRKSSFRRTPEVEHDFDDLFEIWETDERLPDGQGEDIEELGELPTRGDRLRFNRQLVTLASKGVL